ncbi:ChbG/HpnK family deacetylase [Alkaliflexus imshenetskii]|uniref:ChbG/HpnK family deacetylase n=1 Tax=Alkaliflexus imshenetskii TaxID=286730 RepID=UPI0004792AB5|nr:ChbG/HpnK family deacetylase [Alkaliflexus imshenetskii]
MRNSICLMVLLVSMSIIQGLSAEKYLIVRVDDMGSFNAANHACLKTIKSGIARSVEVMVPCPWFPEAVKLLSENPGIDVGIHLVLTSEWETLKWRPLTDVPGLIDSAGYFYPYIWPWEGAEEDIFLINKNWSLAEIEKELRAQIETGLRFLPGVTHLSTHMGFTSMHTSVLDLVKRLGDEYGLLTSESVSLKRLNGWDWDLPKRKRIRQFIKNIKRIDEGYWLFVEHPGMDVDEMRSVGTKIAKDRQFVTEILTNSKVMRAIQKEGITLVGYDEMDKLIKQ